MEARARAIGSDLPRDHVRGDAHSLERRIALMRRRKFEKLIADTKVAIERGDVRRARQFLVQCPSGHERVTAALLFDYSSPLGRKEPPDLLLELYDQARLAGLSLIDAYAQPPEELEKIGRRV
jgi:hypothetical protein